MDRLYIGDIDNSFHYADFNSNYIDLYNVSTLSANHSYTFYRVYMYDNYFCYETLINNTGNYYYTTNLTDIPVSNDNFYRRDAPSVLFMVLFFMVIITFLINVITNFVKRGGIFAK